VSRTRRTISGSWAVATYWRLACIIRGRGPPTTVAPLGTSRMTPDLAPWPPGPP